MLHFMDFSFMFSSIARIIESFVTVFALVGLLTSVGEQVFLMMLSSVGNFTTKSAGFIIICHQGQVRRSLHSSVNITNYIMWKPPNFLILGPYHYCIFLILSHLITLSPMIVFSSVIALVVIFVALCCHNAFIAVSIIVVIIHINVNIIVRYSYLGFLKLVMY